MSPYCYRLHKTVFASAPVKAKDTVFNPVVMSVLLSVLLSVISHAAWHVRLLLAQAKQTLSFPASSVYLTLVLDLYIKFVEIKSLQLHVHSSFSSFSGAPCDVLALSLFPLSNVHSLRLLLVSVWGLKNRGLLSPCGLLLMTENCLTLFWNMLKPKICSCI